MAEPLFKRTFSRLQGRERSCRKRDVPVVSQDHHSLSPQGKPVTMATKQRSQQHGSMAPPTVQDAISSKHAANELASSSKLTQEHLSTREYRQGSRGDEASCIGQRKPVSPPGGSSGVPHVPAGTRLPCQRTYLQNLDSSSRSWVLSSGKTMKPSRRTNELPSESASNIWYNPIPEEEDLGGPCGEGRTWRKLVSGKDEQQLKSSGGKHLNINPHDEITISNPESSVSEGLTSPGTVRKISMKMKKLPELRRKLSFRSSTRRRGSKRGKEAPTNQCVTSSADQNVISRYHLDSSTCPLPHSSQRSSTSKGGYLSDGDSPERLPLPKDPPSSSDFTSFQMYLDSDGARCNRKISGLLTVHLLGLEDMKNSRSDISKEIFLAIQIDDVTRARTAPLGLRGHTLNLNHTFHLELERAQILRLVVLTPGGGSKSKGTTADCPLKNKVCCLREVSIPRMFKGSREQQIFVKLEPQGRLYMKLSLQETWDPPIHSKARGPSNVFGAELSHLVLKEGSTVPVPLLIQKTVNEIERRGLRVVGLYRLCGSAAVKKDLRDCFEKDSSAVFISEDLYPDVNVLTGILKDYLRELPSPLITRTLYQDVKKELALRHSFSLPVVPDHLLTRRTKELLSCLPPPEKATLSLLLDHLSLVASFSAFNRMTHQNLAVCFGPVLLTQPENVWSGGSGGRRSTTRGHHGDVDFNQHIEVLHYLLQLWPVPPHNSSAGQHHLGEGAVVSRRGWGPARMESKVSHRYAGDWSVCGRNDPPHEHDYDEVAGSSSDTESEDEDEENVQSSAKEEEARVEHVEGGAGEGIYLEEFDAPFNCRLSLKDFDNLIHDLDRELTKHIKICL